MKDFRELNEGDKLLMAYHNGDVNALDMGRSICFDEWVVKSICKLGSKWVVTASNKDKTKDFCLDYYKWYALGVDCVILPEDRDNMLCVQELLYAGVVMRNKALDEKARGFFRCLGMELRADSSGSVKF